MTDRTVRVRLEAITSAFQAQMAQAGVSAKGLASQIDGIGAKSEQGFKKLGMGLLDVGAGTVAVTAGAAIAGAALLKFTKAGIDGFVELADEVRGYQRVTGASAEESSKMIAVAHALGVETEAVSSGMFKLARATESHADTLKADGIEVVKNARGQTDLVGTLVNVAEAYRKAGAGAAGDKVVFDAFGRAGKAMIPILAQNREELERLWAAAATHHEILSQSDVDKAFEYKVATRELGEAWSGLAREWGSVTIPAATSLANFLEREARGVDKIANAIGGLIPGHHKAASAAHEQAVAEQALADQQTANAQALSDYSKSLDALSSHEFGVSDAQTKFNKDLIDFADKVRAAQINGDKFATSLDNTTSTGIANQEMVRGLTQDIIATAKAAAAAGESVEAATAMQREALANVLTQLGFNSQAAARYADVLAQIPGDIDTQLHLDTSPAMAALQKYVQALSNIPNGIASPQLEEARRLINNAGIPNDIASPSLLAARRRNEDLYNFLSHLPQPGITGALAGSGTAATAARNAQAKAATAANKDAASAAKTAAQQQEEINNYLKAVYQQRMQIIENQYHAGKVTRDEYLKSLDEQMAHEVPWTDAWVALQQKKTDALAEWDNALKGIQAMQQAFQDNEHEAGVTSNADYLKILQGRLAGLQEFSNDWMAVWRQIQQAEQAETTRLDDARDKALGTLNTLLDQEKNIRGQLASLVSQHEAKVLQIEQQYTADMGKVLNDRRDQLLSWADVTQKVTVKWGVSAAALTRNIRSQVSSFDDWVTALDAARAKGVSDQVIQMLGLDEGPQALGQLKMFATATTSQIDDLNKAVADRAKKVDAEVGREQTQSYSKIGDQLRALAEQHAAAIEQETEDFLQQQKDLNTQLTEIGSDGGRSFGQSLADGLQSSIPAIQAAAKAARDAMAAATQQEQQAQQAATSSGPTPEFLAFFNSQPTDVQNYFLALGQMPAHASGTAYVAQTGPALIHQGERIFSAVDNRQLISAVQSLGGGAPVVQVFIGNREIHDDIRTVLATSRRTAVTASTVAGSR